MAKQFRSCSGGDSAGFPAGTAPETHLAPFAFGGGVSFNPHRAPWNLEKRVRWPWQAQSLQSSSKNCASGCTLRVGLSLCASEEFARRSGAHRIAASIKREEAVGKASAARRRENLLSPYQGGMSGCRSRCYEQQGQGRGPGKAVLQWLRLHNRSRTCSKLRYSSAAEDKQHRRTLRR